MRVGAGYPRHARLKLLVWVIPFLDIKTLIIHNTQSNVFLKKWWIEEAICQDIERKGGIRNFKSFQKHIKNGFNDLEAFYLTCNWKWIWEEVTWKNERELRRFSFKELSSSGTVFRDDFSLTCQRLFAASPEEPKKALQQRVFQLYNKSRLWEYIRAQRESGIIETNIKPAFHSPFKCSVFVRIRSQEVSAA